MPDWEKLVRERMSTLNLPADTKEEVISELAAHLDDAYQNEITRGAEESKAARHVLSEVQWNKLAREIRLATRKEESMSNRNQALWLPVVVNLLVAAVLLIVLIGLGIDERMTQSSILVIERLAIKHLEHFSFFAAICKVLEMIHLSWLLTLPLSAALGCLIARRAQASPTVRLIVGLAPSLLGLAVFIAMSLTFEFDRWQFPSGFPLDFSYFALSVVGWIVLPAIPLLLGTAPFLRGTDFRRGQTN